MSATIEKVVHVVDDDASMLTALCRLLELAGYAVQSFTSATAFLDQHRADHRGCIVTDLRMPGMSGLDLQMALARDGNPLPIIFVTGHGDIPTSVHAMRRGAEDFLTKPVRKADLLASVERALALDAAQFAQRAHQYELKQHFATLTAREREVLTQVIAGKLNKEIAAALGTAEATIKTHRASVMRKLQVQSPAELGRITEQLGAALRNS
jgi:two-component system, LuxR family, response regulator FixJ